VLDRPAGALDRLGGAGDDERGVGEKQRGLDLESELPGIVARVDRPFALGIANSVFELAEPLAQEADEAIADRAGTHIHLRENGSEEATAREGVEATLKTYAIRRKNAWASPEELEEVAARSKSVADDEFPDDIRWIRSYVIAEEDGTLGSICIYQATSDDAIRRHAQRGCPLM
jgi:hypothetical protein